MGNKNEKKIIDANNKFVQVIKKLKVPNKLDNLDAYLNCLNKIDTELDNLVKSRKSMKTELSSKYEKAKKETQHATSEVEKFVVTQLIELTQKIQDKSSFLSSDGWRTCLKTIEMLIENTINKENQIKITKNASWHQLSSWYPIIYKFYTYYKEQCEFYEKECDKYERIQSVKQFDESKDTWGSVNVSLNDKEIELKEKLNLKEIDEKCRKYRNVSKFCNVTTNVIQVVLAELKNVANVMKDPTSTQGRFDYNLLNLNNSVSILKTLNINNMHIPQMFDKIRPAYRNWTDLIQQYYTGSHLKDDI